MHALADSPRIRVAAIIARDGGVLLVRHRKEGKTYWLLPGGGVEYGESLGDALRREVREEACVSIEPGRLVLVNDTLPPDGHRHIVNLAFTAAILEGEPACGSDPRVVEVRFVAVEAIRGLALYPDIRAELVHGLRNGFAGGARYLGNLWQEQA
ncbi:MAG: NUDIX domain-containing protein [Candidatus Hydrogenedentes bacterium]|nr:NUDIX domain-containing protein [Candidatus Hydrogenedentota bacterium]